MDINNEEYSCSYSWCIWNTYIIWSCYTCLKRRNIFLFSISIYVYTTCPIEVNSNTIELTVRTSCNCVLDLVCVKKLVLKGNMNIEYS